MAYDDEDEVMVWLGTVVFCIGLVVITAASVVVVWWLR